MSLEAIANPLLRSEEPVAPSCAPQQSQGRGGSYVETARTQRPLFAAVMSPCAEQSRQQQRWKTSDFDVQSCCRLVGFSPARS
jgi:hypothetical protein